MKMNEDDDVYMFVLLFACYLRSPFTRLRRLHFPVYRFSL